MYCERILVPDLQKVSGQTQLKLAACGYSKLVSECPILYQADGKYRYLWNHIMQV